MCTNFRPNRIKIDWVITVFRTNFSKIPVYLCHSRPRFSKVRSQGGTSAQISAGRNHLALNTRFQLSSIPQWKVINFEKLRKIGKKFRISSKSSKTQHSATQAAKRVIATEKNFTRREKRRIERLSILAWHRLVLFWCLGGRGFQCFQICLLNTFFHL